MHNRLSPLTISVVAALTLLTGSQTFAEAQNGDYGKETALTLARDYAGRYTGSDKEIGAANYMQQRMTIDGSNNQVDRQTFAFVAPRGCLLYTSPSPRDKRQSRMPSSA